MADKRQRDRAIEHMLRYGVGVPRPSVLNNCVDGETLAAWSSGALASAEAARVEDHLADCARCQSMFAAFVRTEPMAAAPAPWWRSAQMRWLVPLATAATVAAIWVAIPQRAEIAQPTEPERTSPAFRNPAEPEPRVVPNQPAPSVSTETAPGTPQLVVPKRDARAAPERKEGFAAPRADEADSGARASGRASNELAAAAPKAAQPAAPPAAAAPAAAAAESAAIDTFTPQRLAQAAGDEIISPGGARWRIVGGQVQRSITQGQSWEPLTLPTATITAGHSPAASVVWLVGKAGAILITTDGTRFEQVPFVSSADLASVVAVDDRQATVTTVDGRRFRTADRGLTWTQQ